jgi:hypothetical protein
MSVSQPPSMTKNLFPHQLSAIHKMEEMESKQHLQKNHIRIVLRLSIYADIAGYGKTLAIIGLLVRDRMPWDLNADFQNENIGGIYGNGYIIKKNIIRYQRSKTNIILAGINLLRQWETELRHTDLHHVLMITKKNADTIDPFNHDVILISPNCYNYFLNKFPNIAWKRFIYDEPTHTKISAMKSIIAGYVWLITATPDMLLYNTRSSNQNFLSTVFTNYMDYHLFRSIIVKNDDDFVRSSIELPPINHHYYTCFQPIYHIFKNLLPQSISDMISAGDMEGAIRALGGDSTSNLIELVKRVKQNSIDECEFKIRRYEREQDEIKTDKWLRKKDALLVQIQELEQRFGLLEYQCHICLSSCTDPVLVSCCQNIYCGRCILEWLKNNTTCPVCREIIHPCHLIYVSKNVSIEGHKNKFRVIIDIITQRPSDHQFIIFSCYDKTFEILQRLLKQHDMTYCSINGSYQQRMQSLERFHNAETRIMLLNSLQDGAGMNLQNTTDIILFHQMKESIETQIIARAQRVGRTCPLEVHHLV